MIRIGCSVYRGSRNVKNLAFITLGRGGGQLSSRNLNLFFDKRRIKLFTPKAGCEVERAHSILTVIDPICPDSPVRGKAAPWLQTGFPSWGAGGECFSWWHPNPLAIVRDRELSRPGQHPQQHPTVCINQHSLEIVPLGFKLGFRVRRDES